MLTKIKNLYQNLKENVFLKYPVTMCGIWVAALLMSIWVEYPFENGEDTFEKIVAFVWIFNAGSLFTEEYFRMKKLWVRCIGFFAAALISFLFVCIGSYEGKTLFGVDMDVVEIYLEYYLIAYLSWITALCIYKMYKDSGEIFEKYCLSVFGSVMRTSIVYGLFALGIAAIILIFETLICDTGETLLRLEVFLVCGLYIPGVLLALSKVIEEAGKFLRLVVKYVLLILTIAAFLVIYLYIVKILFKWELPSNEVFGILSWLFACGMPVWTIAGYFKEDKLGKVAKLLPYAFVPFIILQGICVGLRINEYGLTKERYMGCFLILAEVIYFVLYAVKKERFLPFIFFVAAGLVTIFMLGPVVKSDTMVYLSQKGRFESYIKRAERNENLTEKEINTMLSAYGVLNRDRTGKVYIDNLSSERKNLIQEYKDMDISQDYGVYDYRYVRANWQMRDGMDVSGYREIYEVSEHNYTGDGDLTKVKISLPNEEFTVDLTDFTNRLLEEYDKGANSRYDDSELNEWLRKNGRIPLGNDAILYVKSITMNYKDDDCTDFSLDGYVMKK